MVLESRYGAEGIRDFNMFLSKASISVLHVVYLHLPRKQQIWMLTIYAKVNKKDLTRNDKKVLKQIIQEIKR